MSIPSALFPESGRMPFVLQLLFNVIAIVLLLLSTARSWRYYRAWEKATDRKQKTRFRLPPTKGLEQSLYIVGAMICFIVVDPWWTLRVFFGGIALLALVLTIYRFKEGSKNDPSIAEGSVLHINQM